MNRKQKACILVSIAVIVVMGLFPPWVLERRVSVKKYILEPGPYSWIASPPVIDAEKSSGKWYQSIYSYSAKERITVPARCEATARFIDLYRLGVQFFVVAVVTAGLILILSDKKTKKEIREPIENKSSTVFTQGLLFFTVISSVGAGFIIPIAILIYCSVMNNWNWEYDGLVILFLFLFAGIWILYGIIRWVIIPISRWVGENIKTSEEQQEVKIPAAKGRLVKKMIILVAVGLSFFVSGFLLCRYFTPDHTTDHISQRMPLSFEEIWKPKSAVLVVNDANKNLPKGFILESRQSEQTTNKNDANKNRLSILDSAAINDANENSK